MTALIITAADAVTSAINQAATDGAWSIGSSFTAVRTYADWDEELKGETGLLVDVVPVFDPATDLETRGQMVYMIDVDVGVRKCFGVSEQDSGTQRITVAKVDELVLFIEQINDHFAADRFAAVADLAWKGTEIRACYNREHLRTLRQFTGIVRLTFEGVKDRT